jgi:hypothetical protein
MASDYHEMYMKENGGKGASGRASTGKKAAPAKKGKK